MAMTRFGERLKELREQRSLSVNQLAMYAGVSAAAISRIETATAAFPSPRRSEIGRGSEMPYEQLMDIAGYMRADEIREQPRGYVTMQEIAAKHGVEDLWLFKPEKWDCLSREDLLNLEQYFHFWLMKRRSANHKSRISLLGEVRLFRLP
ncbi:helix-turn-helix transcriptional regulator [Bacillus licheniformis]|nr:helix-turn-helix transcriptional regulator [Bacillus licheniformis]